MRPISFERGYLKHPAGSCLASFGDTRVLCTVTLEESVPRFLKGTHVNDPRVSVRKARHITIASEDPLYFHADGELLCDAAHHIEIIVIPRCLRVVCPQDYA